jgi:hypothetical protein
MKRFLAFSLALMALLGFVAPPEVFAQAAAPTPTVTITGFIDNLTTYSRNISNSDGILNRQDTQWYARTRGRWDVVGTVGPAKGVIGLEIDQTFGQTGSNDSTIVNAGATSATAVATATGTSGSFDLNTDGRGIIEVKWVYVEFPMPLIPFSTITRLGAQPFATAANYKLATYANGDFPGVNLYTTFTPGLKFQGTYVQVEEALVGTQTRNGLSGPFGFGGNTQNRGDDFAFILSPEFTPFKGLEIKPMFSMFHAGGTTSGAARQGRGGVNTTTNFTQPDGTVRGGVNEDRFTVGVDARYRMGPFSLDPTILYQFGSRGVMATAAFADSGRIAGNKYNADISAWLIDIRPGFQLGPLLLQGLVVYSTGNTARNDTLGKVRYFQPLDTDTSYLADWGAQLTSLGVDYNNGALNEASVRMAFPGTSIGWDKYGRIQLGAKATYALTPALSIMAGVNGHWTAEKVDRNGTAVAGAGILPLFAGPRPRDTERYVGTEFMSVLSWRFAPGLAWDNAVGYMIMGPALDALTDPAAGPRNAKDAAIVSSRVRFSF